MPLRTNETTRPLQESEPPEPLAPSLDVVIKLNNEGIRLFELDQNSYTANTFFQMGLDEIVDLKKYIKESEGATNQEKDNTTSSSLPRIPSQHESLPEMIPVAGWSKPLLRPSANNSKGTNKGGEPSSFIFSRALLLRESDTKPATQPAGGESASLLEICTAVMQFNRTIINHIYAACHHTQSYPQRDRSATIKKLEHEYENLFRDLKRIGDRIKQRRDKASPLHVDLDLIVLAIFNNTGVILCDEMARFREASDCFKEVSRLALHVRDLEQRLNEEEIASLCMNIWMVPKTATPTA